MDFSTKANITQMVPRQPFPATPHDRYGKYSRQPCCRYFKMKIKNINVNFITIPLLDQKVLQFKELCKMCVSFIVV